MRNADSWLDLSALIVYPEPPHPRHFPFHSCNSFDDAPHLPSSRLYPPSARLVSCHPRVENNFSALGVWGVDIAQEFHWVRRRGWFLRHVAIFRGVPARHPEYKFPFGGVLPRLEHACHIGAHAVRVFSTYVNTSAGSNELPVISELPLLHISRIKLPRVFAEIPPVPPSKNLARRSPTV